MGQKNFNRIHQLANMVAVQCKEAVDRLDIVLCFIVIVFLCMLDANL